MTQQYPQVFVDDSGRETTGHGNPSFPFAVYESAVSLNLMGHTNWHWHEEMQFSIVTSGTVCFQVENEQFILSQGDGIFINQSLMHNARLMDQATGSYMCINFGSIMLYGFLGSQLYEQYFKPHQGDPCLLAIPLYQSEGWQRDVLEKMSEIVEDYEKKEFGFEYDIFNSLGKMWTHLIRHKPKVPILRAQKTSHNETVQQVITYIEKNYSGKITLAQISKAVSFSESECCRIFKRFTGDTIFTYLKNYRLSQAIQMLQTQSKSVGEVAFETGFPSTSYFIKTFREQFHMTPFEYYHSCHE